jgi:hypothetical protein
MSSGAPTRPTMVRSRIDATRCVNASSLAPRRAISVTIQPGQTAFTVIPDRPSSMANRRVRINTSDFVAA